MSHNPESESFDDRLKKAKEANSPASVPKEDYANNFRNRRAFQMGVELFAAVTVGTGIGYFIDSHTDTKPTFMIVFFFLGVGAGFLNLYRFVKNLGYDIGYKSDKEDVPPQ